MKSFLFVLLGAFSLSACAQSPAPGEEDGATAAAAPSAKTAVEADSAKPEGRARAAIRKLNPLVEVDRSGPAPIAGFREVVVGGQVLYVSDDGRYLLQGALFDVEGYPLESLQVFRLVQDGN
jgi:thiol:disulfide interchange protein DsbC